jgi:hypothetical protein
MFRIVTGRWRLDENMFGPDGILETWGNNFIKAGRLDSARVPSHSPVLAQHPNGTAHEALGKDLSTSSFCAYHPDGLSGRPDGPCFHSSFCGVHIT